MKPETIAIHGGYDGDPTTRSVAVPIYQTVAYEFDSAEHAAALFNLEAEGYRYSRIANPTTSVLERRVAALEGGVEALCVSSGQAAVHYAVVNLAEMGTNIVAAPQLYGTTHTLFAHVLPQQGITVRFGASDRPEAIERLITGRPRRLPWRARESGGTLIRAIARVAPCGVPLIALLPSRPRLLRPSIRRRRRRALADQVHGRHGTTMGGAIIDSGRFPWRPTRRQCLPPDPSYHDRLPTTTDRPFIGRCQPIQRTTDRCCRH